MTGHEDQETDEESGRSHSVAAQDPGDLKAKSADFLAQGRYELTDADFHSRANVRHLMARSDQLEKSLEEVARLREANAKLDKELAVLRERYATRGGQQAFITFCGSAGFAGLGFGISLVTANPPSTREGFVVSVFAALIAVCAVLAQIWNTK